MTPVIPPRRSRIFNREYDNCLYKLRQLVENAFLKLKQWYDIASRYVKRSDSFSCGSADSMHCHLGKIC